MTDYPVTNNTESKRFEIEIDGKLAILEYMIHGKNILYTHTEVPEELSGRGLAHELAHTAMEFAKDQGYRVQAICPFVKMYVEKHPEYQSITWGY
ncbi:MAG: N-acetyltransferase [Anaerolineae bacterium]|nr:N-acetyltransferase [Anaerolineae bacterium]